jgi:tetratricopeptide (TPR) repeat protein/transcriptional regulator with XRE-family HTH domain
MGDDSAPFGSRLRACRLSAGLSQQELADASGMSVRAISYLERGRTLRPYPDSLNRLATALGLDGQARTEFIASAGRRLGSAHTSDTERPLSPAPAMTLLIPRQLPAPAPQFVGRESELTSLTRLLERTAGGQYTMVISAIGGTAGVGKTALAIRWAHSVAGSFPDGQLFLNLRGYDADQPVPATDALAAFLRALGMPGQDIPVDAEERAGIYRSLLAGRRMLIVLDNVSREDQVRLLLPGTPSCAVLVTSRNALRGLVARDGATRLELDLLPMSGAVDLLRELIGERVDAEKDAAGTLAAQCCRLPLALRVAAELASARPGAPLAELTEELADLQHRLDQLDAGGDPRTAVRAVFSWSYGTLDSDAARFFRLAGLHPGPDLDDYAAAALSQASLHDARRLLDQLTRASLMQRTGPGRYGMHDLLRAYARELAADEAARQAALTTLFDYYLHTAATAMDVLYPAETEQRPRVSSPASPVPPLVDEATALAWLDAERNNLVIVAGYAADNEGWHDYAIRLAATLYRYLDAFVHYAEAIALLSSARRAARRAGDVAAEARSLISLAAIDHRFEQYGQATRYLRQALALCRAAGDRAGEARALGNLGLIDLNQGRYRQAARRLRQVLAWFRETGDRSSEARALGNLAFIDVNQGRYRQAERRLRQALALFRAAGDRGGEAETLSTLGIVALRQGNYEVAASHLQQALVGWRDVGFRLGEAEALIHLGAVALRRGDHAGAASQLQLSLGLWRDLGNQRGEAGALNGLGDVALAEGLPELARTHYTRALQLASEVSSKDEEARAHAGLGDADHAAGYDDRARSHWQQALAIFAELGAPEADEVRARLAETP